MCDVFLVFYPSGSRTYPISARSVSGTSAAAYAAGSDAKLNVDEATTGPPGPTAA